MVGKRRWLWVLVWLASLGVLAGAALADGVIERASLNGAGEQGNGGSGYPTLSGDGRLVAFLSAATNLAPDDTNLTPDVFVRDRQTGVTTRVSVNSAGQQAAGYNAYPAISRDGRIVVFASDAANLAEGDANGVYDVFAHDRDSSQTERLSLSSAGVEGNGGSYYPAPSADGRYVAFYSVASNLVEGDTNGASDIFVRDRALGATTRVSVSGFGGQGNDNSYYPTISADGRYVAFHSAASNLVALDSNGATDVFLHDRETGLTTRLMGLGGAQPNGASSNAALSGNGRYVAFRSTATNLAAGDTNGQPDVFVYDRETAETRLASVGAGGALANGSSDFPAVNLSGRFVAFQSSASNLVAGDANGLADLFLWDRNTGGVTRLSVSSEGAEANGASVIFPALNDTGALAAFQCAASNLIGGDTNAAYDVFLSAQSVAPAWDVNEDGIGDIGDVVRIGLYWGQTGAPGWVREDVNADGVCDIGDVVIVGLHWGETW